MLVYNSNPKIMLTQILLALGPTPYKSASSIIIIDKSSW